jgi:hypothetical protein
LFGGYAQVERVEGQEATDVYRALDRLMGEAVALKVMAVLATFLIHARHAARR